MAAAIERVEGDGDGSDAEEGAGLKRRRSADFESSLPRSGKAGSGSGGAEDTANLEEISTLGESRAFETVPLPPYPATAFPRVLRAQLGSSTTPCRPSSASSSRAPRTALRGSRATGRP